MWARLQRWQVPELHIRICHWLETCLAPERVLLVFRGAAKSTIYAVYKAWKLYRNRAWRSLIYAADDKLAGKLTRDTVNVLRRHPLCGGMLPAKPGSKAFWVLGATDARNPSMEAVGVSSNATGSRTDDVDFDDIEVPKNIKTADARENLRAKIEDSTHIAVPGAQFTYVGTPHTHNSIYTEVVEGGAAVLKIPLFEHVVRYENTEKARRYRFNFKPASDGLYVFAGIHTHARLLVEGKDYELVGREVVFTAPPGRVIDICAGCAWPERFTRADLEIRRRKTKTLNGWDSQYQLEAKPLTEVRLNPDRLRLYDCEPVVRPVNGETVMTLGSVRIVGAAAYWDCSLGKTTSDDSAFSVVFTDDKGRLYWHRAAGLTGELADFDEKTGQCFQLRAIVEELSLPVVFVETNGPGGFVPPILRRALKGTHCAVREVFNVTAKEKRILDAIEAPLSSRFLWAHVSLHDTPAIEQMRDFKPELKNQKDDYLDSAAGAISETPVRIGKHVATATARVHEDWRPNTGVHEVTLEL
jgi:hypothetical protein